MKSLQMRVSRFAHKKKTILQMWLEARLDFIHEVQMTKKEQNLKFVEEQGFAKTCKQICAVAKTSLLHAPYRAAVSEVNAARLS